MFKKYSVVQWRSVALLIVYLYNICPFINNGSTKIFFCSVVRSTYIALVPANKSKKSYRRVCFLYFHVLGIILIRLLGGFHLWVVLKLPYSCQQIIEFINNFWSWHVQIRKLINRWNNISFNENIFVDKYNIFIVLI